MYTARVISGRGRGKGLGFPTFNLEIPKDLNLEEGIYAARVMIGAHIYKGAMHFGPVPVFKDVDRTLEIFVLDYNETEKVGELTFEIIKYLRPIQNFDSAEALRTQIALDVEQVRQL